MHTGTLALALQPSGAVIENLLGRARDRMTISVDPNLRTQLIPAISYRQRIDVWAALSDIIRLSEDDLEQLWPGWTPEQAADHLHKLGVALVVVSLGAAGAFASLRGDQPARAHRAHHPGGHRRRRGFLPRRPAAPPRRNSASSAAGSTPSPPATWSRPAVRVPGRRDQLLPARRRPTLAHRGRVNQADDDITVRRMLRPDPITR